MDANQYVLVHGMRRTRSILEQWGERPWPVLGAWFGASALISLALLGAVTLVGINVLPDIGFSRPPKPVGGADLTGILTVMGRNSLVLALHAFACIAGFIAGATLPLTAAQHTGLSRVIHEKARPIAFAWVIGVTTFSLLTQSVGLGITGSTLAFYEGISVPVLVLTTLPHALMELTAVFLPLAAWTLASRRGAWDQLLAATFVTVAIAIPMLLIAATWEVHVWPYILQSVSPTGGHDPWGQ